MVASLARLSAEEAILAGYDPIALSADSERQSDCGKGDPHLLGLALIDYDNFRRRDRKSKADMELDTRMLLAAVISTFVSAFPYTRELDVRLYGGWMDTGGWPSRDASRLNALLPGLRGRRSGVIVRPSLATTMIGFPGLLLRGTVRGIGRRQRQKMVDGMMSCDALHMARQGQTYIGIVTDDDDLVPATVSAHDMVCGRLVWMRGRSVGSAVNDAVLLNRGLPIRQLRI